MKKDIRSDALFRRRIYLRYSVTRSMDPCKVAMDIVTKHIPADRNGVRIAELDVMNCRRSLWSHRPLMNFWRVGRGYARRLEASGMFTMGDAARCSLEHEDLLYRLFGVNAELLIDHAWGWDHAPLQPSKPISRSPTASAPGR